MADRALHLGVIGAGRIGTLHAENIAARIPAACLAGVADLNVAAAQTVAKQWTVSLATADYRQLLTDASIDAVVICSTTDTHAQIIEEAAAGGKHIFCEKPIDPDLQRIRRALEAVDKAGVKLQVGFNRRFDPSFAKARELVVGGKIGAPHIVRITSRDPTPPLPEYLRVSGGLLLDMTIHDFDMMRFLTGSDAEEIYAAGAALIDPEVGRAGDVDTCIVTMRLTNGALATIDNSRKAVYGYDQRVEVFGVRGMVTVANRAPDSHLYLNADGAHSSKPYHFFVDRYQESYVAEMRDFVDCVINDRAPSVTGADGLRAAIMGVAATRSLKERRPVRTAEIG